MSNTDSLIQIMNMVTLEDEEEIGKVDFLALQHTMAALWKPGKGVYIKELDTNLYLFQFFHEVDVKRVMEGCPWSFNRRALVMAHLKEGENPRSVDLNSMELWVQVHDLNPGYMSKKILKGIVTGKNNNDRNERDDRNLDPHFSPTNQGDGCKAENQENKEFQTNTSEAGKKFMHNTKSAATIMGQENNKKDFAFIESIKRRIEDGLSSLQNMGRNKDVIMDLSDELEIEQQYNLEEINDPKNELRAGVHADARLTL
ncbi:hypothetical protein AgCh_018260 [Apium graveolens]